MNPYEFGTQEIMVIPTNNGYYTIEVIRYWYTRQGVPCSETSYKWQTNCQELVRKLQSEKIRTKVFTKQLMVLAKQFGTIEHIKYKEEKKFTLKRHIA